MISAIIVSDSASNDSSACRAPADRRRHLVEITDEGLPAFDSAEEGTVSVEDDVLAGLSRDERDQLDTLLAKALD